MRTLLFWPPRRWIAAMTGTVLAALAMGIPTGIVATSFYSRMTPVRWWDYPIWVATSVLIGLSLATYIRVSSIAPSGRSESGKTVGGSLLSVFAIGCPVCNKFVVALLGFSGALTYFAPVQPVLGLLSIILLTYGLVVRLRGEVACPVMDAPASP